MQKLWNVVKNVLAVVGGIFLLLVTLAVVLSDPHAERKKPVPVSRVCVEFKVPQLNWQAADKKAAEFLNGIAEPRPFPLTIRREETFAGAMHRVHAEKNRQAQFQPMWCPPPQPVVIKCE